MTLPKFSVIVTAVDDGENLRRLLVSLASQTYRGFEVVLVEQGSDYSCAVAASGREEFRLVRVRVPAKGVSAARNAGMEIAQGDVLSFPDDDAYYSRELLERVALVFHSYPLIDGISCNCAEPGLHNKVLRGGRRWIDKSNVWRLAVSSSIFLRRAVIEKTGKFDETLGVGCHTPWQAGEETDYLLRAMATGSRIMYCGDILVYHLPGVGSGPSHGALKARRYGRGFGFVLRRHRYHIRTRLYWCLRPFIGLVLSLGPGRAAKASYHWQLLLGRLEGMLGRQFRRVPGGSVEE
jgi:glycosyltransferase involved in cell wall biosynthesis